MLKHIIMVETPAQAINAIQAIRHAHKDDEGWVSVRVDIEAPRCTIAAKIHFGKTIWVQKFFGVLTTPVDSVRALVDTGAGRIPTHLEGAMELKPRRFEIAVEEAVDHIVDEVEEERMAQADALRERQEAAEILIPKD